MQCLVWCIENSMTSHNFKKRSFIYKNISRKYCEKNEKRVLRWNVSLTMLMHVIKSPALLIPWFSMCY